MDRDLLQPMHTLFAGLRLIGVRSLRSELFDFRGGFRSRG